MKQRFIRIASSVAAVLLLAVGLIWLCHADPIEAFGYFCYGLFGSLNGFAEIFVKATPLILMGLGVSISFQTGFFNIGAEGQFYMGALMATFVAIKLPGPPWFRCILAIFVAFIFGGVCPASDRACCRKAAAFRTAAPRRLPFGIPETPAGSVRTSPPAALKRPRRAYGAQPRNVPRRADGAAIGGTYTPIPARDPRPSPAFPARTTARRPLLHKIPDAHAGMR